MKTQIQMYWDAHRRLADADQHVMEMIKDPKNPLTAKDLRTLAEKFPQRWGRYLKLAEGMTS